MKVTKSRIQETLTILSELGEVVLIRFEDKHRGKKKIGIVTDTIEGGDGAARAVKLSVGTSCLERAVQHLFPLELSCDQPRDEEGCSAVLRAEIGISALLPKPRVTLKRNFVSENCHKVLDVKSFTCRENSTFPSNLKYYFHHL